MSRPVEADGYTGGRRRRALGAGGACVALALSSAALPAQAQFMQRGSALTNATVLSPSGQVIEDATILLQGGNIGRVAPAFEPPGNTRTTDLGGRFVTPGLTDPNSFIAMTGGQTEGRADAVAADSFDRYDRLAVQDAWRNGLTAAFVPATGTEGFTGVGGVVRLAPRDDGGFGVWVEREAALCINLASGAGPIQRAEIFADVIAEFRGAEQYREALDIYEEELDEYLKALDERNQESDEDADKAKDEDGDSRFAEKDEKEGDDEDELEKPTEPEAEPAYDVLLRAIDGDLSVRVTAHRAADIVNAAQLATDFGVEVIIVGGTDADLVAAQLADAGVTVVLDPVTGPGSPRDTERAHRMRDVAAALSAAGVRWSVGSGATGSAAARTVLLSAQEVTDGSADGLALATRRAAFAVGAPQLGALRPGAVADMVVWSGHPLEPGSYVERVYVDGQPVFTSPRSDLWEDR